MYSIRLCSVKRTRRAYHMARLELALHVGLNHKRAGKTHAIVSQIGDAQVLGVRCQLDKRAPVFQRILAPEHGTTGA